MPPSPRAVVFPERESRPRPAPDGWFSERSVRGFVIVLLCLKLLLTGWATAVHKEHVYDGDHHLHRARSGGLQMDKMAYNPPLYYFPALAAQGDKARMRILRVSNIVWIGMFYLLWLLVIFPAVLPSKRAQLVASLLLLALPGYQKLAAMVHPDNLHAALAALGVAAWVLFRRRVERDEPDPDWRPLIAVAAAIGIAGWTRPFAAATVAALSVALAFSLYRGFGFSGRFWRRLFVSAAIVGTLSSSWYLYRWAETGVIGPAYRPGYQKRFAKDRKTFDYTHYFTTFYYRDLLKTPHRTDSPRVPHKRGVHNSFFTLMYSEIWGDHWLYFSGRPQRDGKVGPKRLIFVVGLPLIPLLLWAMIRSSRALLKRRRRLLSSFFPILLFAGYAAIAIAWYLLWSTGSALEPGKNAAVKFTYNAHIFPLGLAVAFALPLRQRSFDLWVGYALLLNFVAFPIALYWRI